MQEIARKQSALGCKRIFYKNNEGQLVERLLELSEDVNPIIKANLAAQSEYSSTAKSKNFRVVAEIPPETFLNWLKEDGVPGFCDAEALDCVVNKKLRQPENKYFLTVPSTYRMMRYG